MKQWLETRQVLGAIGSLPGSGQRAALATVIRVRGSAYRHEGAKLLLTEEGVCVGNVSGGCLEADVREVALRVMRSGVAQRRSYCGTSDEIAAWDLGVGCEGVVDLLITPVCDDWRAEREAIAAEEPFVICTRLDDGVRSTLRGRAGLALAKSWESRVEVLDGVEHFINVLTPPPRLVVASAGDDACQLARLAHEVGFRVVVVDRRPGLLVPARFPAGVRLIESEAATLGEHLALDADDFAITMTHHFADDTNYLRALLRSPARYIGVLGPRRRTERILATLEREGPVDQRRIYGPVGLDIGTDGAEQVALAVVAELLAVRSGRRPSSLRERTAPIHLVAG